MTEAGDLINSLFDDGGFYILENGELKPALFVDWKGI